MFPNKCHPPKLVDKQCHDISVHHSSRINRDSVANLRFSSYQPRYLDINEISPTAISQYHPPNETAPTMFDISSLMHFPFY